jgi:hypothetical protein
MRKPIKNSIKVSMDISSDISSLDYSSLPYAVAVGHLTFDMLDWARKRLAIVEYRWMILPGTQAIYFKHEHDAVAFKLTFNL